MATGVRSLDIAQEATIGAVALNNKVVSMRPVVRRAKLFVTRRIIRHIKKLENKKGTPEQLEKNARKAERLLEEVKVIRHVKPDKVSKYALASTDKFDDVCKQAGTSLETRALCRLSLNPVLQKVVAEFREQHYDWKSLAAYLLTKETGRKYKIKKKGKNQKIVSTNITASKALVQTYLGAKLGKEVSSNLQSSSALTQVKNSNKAESEVFEIDQSKCSEIDQSKCSEIDQSESSEIDQSKCSEIDQSKCSKIDQSRCSEIDQAKCSEIDQSESFESSEHSDQEISESEHSFVMGSGSGSEVSYFDSNELKEKARNRKEIRKPITSRNKNSSPESSSLPVTKDESVVRKVRNQEEIRKKTISPNINSLQESGSLPITKDEMVVKRIDLNHLDWDNSVKKQSELPRFLLQNPNKESKDKKILKDSFFAASDDDHDIERDKDDIDNSSDEEEEHHDTANLYDNNTTEKKISKSHIRNQGEKSSLWSGKRAFESTFVGSLSEKKSETRQNFSFKEKRLQNRFQGFEKDFRQNSARSWDNSKGRPHQGKRKAYDSRPISKTFNKFSAQDGKWSCPDFQRNFQQKSVNGQSFSGGIKSTKAAEKEVLHPSWQASKIKKEQEKIHQFQGKKIKFEDD